MYICGLLIAGIRVAIWLWSSGRMVVAMLACNLYCMGVYFSYYHVPCLTIPCPHPTSSDIRSVHEAMGACSLIVLGCFADSHPSTLRHEVCLQHELARQESASASTRLLLRTGNTPRNEILLRRGSISSMLQPRWALWAEDLQTAPVNGQGPIHYTFMTKLM